MTEKLNQKTKEYDDRFESGFPMIPLGWYMDDEELIAVIDDCLAQGKDAYELGYVEDDKNILY